MARGELTFFGMKRPVFAGAQPAGPGRFSLIDGDPLFELQRAAHLAGGRHPVLPRALMLALVGYVPPLVLALVFGAPHGALVPLHTRFLLAIPIMLWAEGFVDQRVQSAVASFTARGLVKPADLPRFQSIVADAERLHHSMRMAVAIIAIAFGISSLEGLVGLTTPMTAGTVAATNAHTTAQTTAIEWWVAFLSLPLFRVVLLQWLWRWVVWAILMARTSGLDLQLEPAHPDLAGGLGFLEQAAISFLCLQVATGAVIAGRLATKLLPVRQEIAGFTLITLVMVLGPLALFSRKLFRAKRRGELTYGELASRHNRLFGQRWFGGDGAEPLGDPSFSSLADLSSGYDSISRMRPLPIGRLSLLLLVMVCLAPAVPALLAGVPLNDMLVRVVKTVLL
jgi:hypothetical protein